MAAGKPKTGIPLIPIIIAGGAAAGRALLSTAGKKAAQEAAKAAAKQGKTKTVRYAKDSAVSAKGSKAKNSKSGGKITYTTPGQSAKQVANNQRLAAANKRRASKARNFNKAVTGAAAAGAAAGAVASADKEKSKKTPSDATRRSMATTRAKAQIKRAAKKK